MQKEGAKSSRQYLKGRGEKGNQTVSHGGGRDSGRTKPVVATTGGKRKEPPAISKGPMATVKKKKVKKATKGEKRNRTLYEIKNGDISFLTQEEAGGVN